MDPYIQAPVDLSHVTWIATANGADTLPAPLRDRFRIVRVPGPTTADLVPLSRALMRDSVAERGLGPAWPGRWTERSWTCSPRSGAGGSLRSHSRYVGAILDACDRAHGVVQ